MQPDGLVPRARGRIYVAFGEHPAAGGWGLEFVGWVVSVLCVVCVFVCGCVFVCVRVCLCVCVFVLWVCYWLFVSSCACCWHLWVPLWHFAGPCAVSLALRVAFGIHCDTLGFHFDTHGV